MDLLLIFNSRGFDVGKRSKKPKTQVNKIIWRNMNFSNLGMASDFKIVNASLEDINFFLSLAKTEGWNPGLCDAIPFYSTDPNGFFIGIIGEKKIGCVSSVAYNSNFGFLGFYIVIPEYRGQGYGIQLWNKAIEYLGNRVIGLDGVIAQQENYKKSSFKFYYRNIRFEGKSSNFSTISTSSSLIELNKIPFETLLKYDSEVFGLNREIFLNNWISMPNSLSLAKMDRDRLVGFGLIRSCVDGYKIGPLFADNLEIATEIYNELSSKIPKGPIFLDVPEINLNALKLAENAKFTKVFETARMYTKPPPKQYLNKIYGVSTFELG
mgnify:CR=1 FL=1